MVRVVIAKHLQASCSISCYKLLAALGYATHLASLASKLLDIVL